MPKPSEDDQGDVWPLEFVKGSARKGASTRSPIVIFVTACFLSVQKDSLLWFRTLREELDLAVSPLADIKPVQSFFLTAPRYSSDSLLV